MGSHVQTLAYSTLKQTNTTLLARNGHNGSFFSRGCATFYLGSSMRTRHTLPSRPTEPCTGLGPFTPIVYYHHMSRKPTPKSPPVAWRLTAIAATILVSLTLVMLVIQLKPPNRALPISVTTADWRPYLSTDLPQNGPLAQISAETFQSAGYQANFTFTTWTLAQQSVTNGSSLAVIAMVKSKQRDELFLYSDPILELRYTLFGKSIENLDAISQRGDLKGLRVALIDGYEYWQELEDSRATFVNFRTSEEAFQALAAGKVDLVAEDILAGKSVIASEKLDLDSSEITEVPPKSSLTTSTQSLHMLVRDSQEGRQLVDDFNSALAEYRKTAEYDQHISSLQSEMAKVTIEAGGGTVQIFTQGSPSSPLGVTPSGTRGIVVEWPNSPQSDDALAKIKLLNGPWKGRIVEIELKYVVISDV